MQQQAAALPAPLAEAAAFLAKVADLPRALPKFSNPWHLRRHHSLYYMPLTFHGNSLVLSLRASRTASHRFNAPLHRPLPGGAVSGSSHADPE